jgi:hypothetical protein
LLKKITLTILVLILSVLCFVFSKDVSRGVIIAIGTCLNLIVPSLFVFLVLSIFIINTKISYYLFYPIRFIFKFIFKVDDIVADALILSFLGGFPVGAKLLSQLVKNNQLKISDAQKITFFAVNAGPAFIISGISCTIFNNYKIGVIMLICQTISALFIAFFMRFNSTNIKTKTQNELPIDLLDEFIFAVNSSGVAILKMCVFILFFSGLIEILKTNLILPFDRVYQALFYGIIELSYGCNMLFGLNGIIAIIVASIISCFGGICVHFQIFQILKDCKMNIKKFYFYKLLQSLFSSILVYISLSAFDFSREVFNQNSTVKPIIYEKSIDFSIVFLILCVLLLSCCKFSDKIELNKKSLK